MTKTQSLQTSAKHRVPSASDFTSSPLRNRIRMELDCRDVMKWYEPNRGYLSIEADGSWGGGNTVAFTTLDPIPRGTRLTCDMHFDAEDLDAAKTHLAEALGDIAENLIRRFGGRLTEHYVEE